MINDLARDPRTAVSATLHAQTRQDERSIDTPLIRFALENGVVREDPEPAEDPDYDRCVVFCISLDCASPREIAVVCVPKPDQQKILIVSSYWVDDRGSAGGSIVGGGDE